MCSSLSISELNRTKADVSTLWKQVNNGAVFIFHFHIKEVVSPSVFVTFKVSREIPPEWKEAATFSPLTSDDKRWRRTWHPDKCFVVQSLESTPEVSDLQGSTRDTQQKTNMMMWAKDKVMHYKWVCYCNFLHVEPHSDWIHFSFRGFKVIITAAIVAVCTVKIAEVSTSVLFPVCTLIKVLK